MDVRKAGQEEDAARSGEPCDLVIRDCLAVDPVTRSIRKTSVGIRGARIAGLGEYRGRTEIDGRGLYASAGLIDAHVHIESSLCTPARYAELVLPCGTTQVIADPHEIANVAGTAGIRFMQESARRCPLKIRFMVPSCVPAAPFEDSGASLGAEETEALLASGEFLGLGEVMDVPGVLSGEAAVHRKISAAVSRGLPVDGHAPGLSGKKLDAYIACGIRTDHECSSPQEAEERVQKGMYVLLRQGSAAQDLRALLPAVRSAGSGRMCFCSDDKHPEDILRKGHINENLRIAVENGISVFDALAMATVNAAGCYGLKDTGLLAPGYFADIVLFRDLQNFEAVCVLTDGVVRAKDGRCLFVPEEDAPVPPVLRDSVRIRPVTEADFVFPVPSGRKPLPAFGVQDGSLFTPRECFSPDSAGFCKIAEIERHKKSGRIGKAFVRGMGIRSGALASTVCHDSHNLAVCGTDARDMLLAVRELERCGGGLTVVRDGAVLETLPLETGGLMRSCPPRETAAGMERVLAAAKTCMDGQGVRNPFMTLSFLCLPVIPAYKLTVRGLYDVERGLFVEDGNPF
ncbi:MAG: adenine deaminase [Spirochaetes bacterium]|uniref:Adenine deaminase n=1 Tax=Candidatus Avitreponema avistercoris TaxID=2840705 RepID=A0A9D9HFJ8_9SPIR|nr:adenine deaminase [Candidatus Avitreponema avistercoris]